LDRNPVAVGVCQVDGAHPQRGDVEYPNYSSDNRVLQDLTSRRSALRSLCTTVEGAGVGVILRQVRLRPVRCLPSPRNSEKPYRRLISRPYCPLHVMRVGRALYIVLLCLFSFYDFGEHIGQGGPVACRPENCSLRSSPAAADPLPSPNAHLGARMADVE